MQVSGVSGGYAMLEAFAGASSLWVPEALHTSRDVPIFMEQSVEPVPSSDAARLARRALGEWS